MGGHAFSNTNVSLLSLEIVALFQICKNVCFYSRSKTSVDINILNVNNIR